MLTKLKERNNQLMQQELKYLKRNMLKPKIEGMKTKNAENKWHEEISKYELNSHNLNINKSISRLRNKKLSLSKENSERNISNLTNSIKLHSIKKKRLILNKLELRSVEDVLLMSKGNNYDEKNPNIHTKNTSTKYLINSDMQKDIQGLKEKNNEF